MDANEPELLTEIQSVAGSDFSLRDSVPGARLSIGVNQ